MESHCLKHQDRTATKRCVSCLKPLCDECCQAYADGIYCGDTCHEAAKEAQERAALIAQSDKELAEWKQKQLAIKLIVTAVLVMVVIAGWDHLPPAFTDTIQDWWDGLTGIPDKIEQKK
jgi:hypothetical protein